MHTIVLAEPRKSYRAILERSLGTSFHVVCASSVPGALRAVSLHDARAVVAGLFQEGDSNGLQLALQARHAHTRLITIVYGAPKGGVSPTQVERVAREFELTLFLARALPPTELADHLAGELRREIAATTTAVGRRLANAEHQDAAAMPTFTASTDRSMSEDTWVELIHREVSPRSLRKLAAKPIGFDPIERSWSDEDPTWGQLMRTKATPGAVRVLVRKGLGLKVKKPA